VNNIWPKKIVLIHRKKNKQHEQSENPNMQIEVPA